MLGPCCWCKWHYFIVFNVWVTFHCIYVPHLLYPFLCWWTFRLLPCLGYYKQCCNEYWGAQILSNNVLEKLNFINNNLKTIFCLKYSPVLPELGICCCCCCCCCCCVQPLNCVQLFAAPWTIALQASMSFTLPEFAQTHVHSVGDAT